MGVGAKYELGERLGAGGMADVYCATVRGAEGFSRSVAIKCIRPRVSTHKGFAELFVQEAKIASYLTHPNIVQTLDFERDDVGNLYLVMELIRGVDLRTLADTGRLPVAACCYLISEVLRGLDYAHELVNNNGPVTIIHRDISPHNIMLGWLGEVKLVDFGIAKAVEASLVVQSGTIRGKISYMSPEQVRGQALDGRTDLFSIGAVFHELLTGKKLFAAKSDADTLSRLLGQPIVNPCQSNDLVPKEVGAVVMRLLQRARTDRFFRAREVIEELAEGPVSLTKGRRDLEMLLAERFPQRVPERTARLVDVPQAHGPKDVRPSSLAAHVSATAKAIQRTLTSEPLAPQSSSNLLPLPRGRDDTVIAKPGWRGSSTAVGLLMAAVVLGGLFVTRERLWGERESLSTPVAVQPAAQAATLPTSQPEVGTETLSVSPTFVPVPKEGLLESLLEDAGAVDSAAKQEESTVASEPGVPVPTGVLNLIVKPWALITIDSKSHGQTPQTIRLKRGKHRVVLVNDEIGKRESFSVVLKSGKTQTIVKNWNQ